MIVSAHVASGAAAGAVAGSRLVAVVLGPVLHYIADIIPHEDVASHRFEAVSGALGIAALALTRGPLDAATLGALASSAPDLEHELALPRRGGRKLFPSHRSSAGHGPGGIPAWAQLLAAGAVLGGLLAWSWRR